MCSDRFPDGQFGSELRCGPELEPQMFPTGGLQPLCVSGEVYFQRFVLFDKRKGSFLNQK